MDHKLTPRLSAEVFVLPKVPRPNLLTLPMQSHEPFLPLQVVQTSYQMCFVAYLSTWIATCLKLVFESNPTKLRLNVLVLYICTIAAGSYFLVWIEYSPILLGEGACLFVPQRYIFYAATIPAMMNLLGQISNYSQRLQALLIVLHYVMLAAGLAGTLPSLSRPLRFLCYSVAIAPFPVILFHKWRMITQGMDNTDKPAAKQALNFIRVYGLVMYQVFPIVYFGAIEGQWPIELVEPTLAIADWFCKVISSTCLTSSSLSLSLSHSWILITPSATSNFLPTSSPQL